MKSFVEIMEAKRNEYSRVIRELQDLTLSSAGAVYKWCAGQAVPPALKRRLIADYLGVPEDELWPCLRGEEGKGVRP